MADHLFGGRRDDYGAADAPIATDPRQIAQTDDRGRSLISLPIISPSLSLALAFALMLLVAIHAKRTQRSNEPASRKRIRGANACLIMLTLPLVAVGFSVVNPRTHPRAWMLVWIAAMALLAMNVSLAVLDVANTARLVRNARRRLNAELLAESAARRDDSNAP